MSRRNIWYSLFVVVFCFLIIIDLGEVGLVGYKIMVKMEYIDVGEKKWE